MRTSDHLRSSSSSLRDARCASSWMGRSEPKKDVSGAVNTEAMIQ